MNYYTINPWHGVGIVWQQNYPNWKEHVDTNIETMLQYSNFKEALEVIEKVKSTL